MVVRLALGELAPLRSDELGLGLLVARGPAFEEAEQVHLDSQDPPKRDQLGRPSQDLGYSHREQVAFVQQVGHARSVPCDPVGHAVSGPRRVALAGPGCSGAVAVQASPSSPRRRRDRAWTSRPAPAAPAPAGTPTASDDKPPRGPRPSRRLSAASAPTIVRPDQLGEESRAGLCRSASPCCRAPAQAGRAPDWGAAGWSWSVRDLAPRSRPLDQRTTT